MRDFHSLLACKASSSELAFFIPVFYRLIHAHTLYTQNIQIFREAKSRSINASAIIDFLNAEIDCDSLGLCALDCGSSGPAGKA